MREEQVYRLGTTWHRWVEDRVTAKWSKWSNVSHGKVVIDLPFLGKSGYCLRIYICVYPRPHLDIEMTDGGEVLEDVSDPAHVEEIRSAVSEFSVNVVDRGDGGELIGASATEARFHERMAEMVQALIIANSILLARRKGQK